MTRKEALVDSIVAYLLEHGLADLSLRPLAAATGTSARLLIYHFESKEGLLTEILEAMQARLRQSFARLLEPQAGGKQPQPPLKLLWHWAIADANYPYFKLLYELQILAIQNPEAYAQYLQRNALNWSDLILSIIPAPRRDPAFATLCGAVFDGLFLELMGTGDRKRTTQALDRFIRIVGDARAFRADT
ncbi:TetR/AcrR family transcriptional regulator [Rhodanobacter sp. DHB23]|uniref:TetR/AcrR family transcriptional regulator n=1 Tax=Rhodanobacter sp. DHB23 TaxID=2775923 RepID=UPI00177DBB23|nr:TetR/AcrR family transcriptional regulator [Rhodanobacter sp. DHB23]MBD8874401.1 TetR/AcrR family transcriptional regulator [Rhodanobacter sp. DHB23]